jgi:tape measure domain-containing protein
MEGGDHFMSSIDERVVEAKFDNRQFQEGVKGTLNSLDSLKKGLQMDGSTQGLNGLANATGKVSHGLNVMRIAAITAISTIAHQATLAGEQLIKSFTLGPLIDGFHEYETQLTSVQTILSNTQWEHTGMSDVNNALNQLNHYADKTIYNFSEMARNVGTFTAAGVKLDVSVNAIKGIANLAAVSGSNAQQASTAMYQLSQALASGTVKLMDWNSVVNAGMGGKVFQDALIQTAKVHNVKIDQMIKKEGSFRNTLRNGWLTSKILTETLSKFTGEESRAQLKRQGYTEKEIEQIIKLGKTATDAATKIKTGTQLISTLKEAAGSGWTQTWQLIIGNFGQAKKMWTDVYNVLGGAINHMSNARNRLLKDWAAIGGRQSMLDGIKFAFQDLLAVLKPIKDAFREIFPKKDAFQLLAMTDAVRDFFSRLKMGQETADKVKRVFAGLFAILDIGWQLIKAGVHFFGQLIGTIGHTSGGVLDFAATLGDALVKLDQAIKTGHGFTKFFDTLHKAIAPVIGMLGMTRIRMLDLGIGVAALFKGLTETAPKILNSISSAIHNFFNSLAGTFHFDKLLQLINAGLFAGLLLMIRKFINHLKKRSEQPNPLERFIDKITEPFTQLTKTLKEMQQAIMAATILEIAVAVGILTASVIALSGIDTVKLAKALGAITVMFAQLIGALWLFKGVGGAKGLFATSAGLILFATAIRVLTMSVKALAKLSWQELAKGLVGVTALLGALVATTRGMQTEAGGMVRAGAGLLILAAAIKVLASAVTDISKLSWSEIVRGLTGVGALLVGLTLFTKFSAANKGGLAQGAGLLLLGAAIKVLASAMQDFGKMSWGNIAKGLVTVGAILLAFTIFSKTVGNPVRLLAAGAALVAHWRCDECTRCVDAYIC